MYFSRDLPRRTPSLSAPLVRDRALAVLPPPRLCSVEFKFLRVVLAALVIKTIEKGCREEKEAYLRDYNCSSGGGVGWDGRRGKGHSSAACRRAAAGRGLQQSGSRGAFPPRTAA
jgi:hypothetical protein